MKAKVIFTITCLLLFSTALASDLQRGEKVIRLTKPTKSIDIAVGILDVGKVQHAVFNDGRLATWDYRTEVPAVFYKGWSYVPDLFLMIGVPEGPWTPKYYDEVLGDSVSMGPSVSETHVGNDWGPRAGSLGELHSGDVTLDDIFPGTLIGELPVMATSTIPETWPKDAEGNRFWPGPWAKDPKTGEELVGTFTSDKDIFFSITDFDLDDRGQRYAERDDLEDQGYALGIQIDIAGFSYGRSYAEDFIFFPMKIINKSPYDYEGMYVGFYCDVDVPEYNLQRTINDRMDWMGFLRSEYDPEKDTTYTYNMAFIYDYRWGTGDFSGVEDPDAWKVYVAIKLLETPMAPQGEQLGLTDWHWFEWENRPGVVIRERQELIQYKVMSGDTSGLEPEEEAAYFWPDPAGVLDPHYDSPASIQKDFPNGLDCVYIMSSGPFNLAAGDTTTFAFCLLMGDNYEDMKFNARTAQFMYELNYMGADPPKTPTVTAVPGDGKVTLYWDRAAEESIDIMTGYKDFEGYRIYRTTTDPVNNEWGEKIYDGFGNVVGFVPIAQFDLDNSIKGLDPEYPHLNLGNNTGLVHSWTDYTVKNGVTYWYSVCSYDRGVREDPELNPDDWPNLNSLECPKGTNPLAAPNLVMVVPGPPPSNFEGPTVDIEPLPGTLGNGPISATIIDQYAVTGHSYILSFDDTTSPGTLYYNVLDENTGDYVITYATETAGEEGPIFDGLRLTIQRFDDIAVWKDSTRWYYEQIGTPSETNWSISATPSYKLPADYEIRFVGWDQGDSSINNMPSPFEIWNVTANTKVRYLNVPSKTDTTTEMKFKWTSGDQLTLQEEVEGKKMFTWLIKLTADPETTFVEIDTTIAGVDTTIIDTVIIDIPPKTGDVARIVSTKPFRSIRDRFRINTRDYVLKAPEEEDLDRIRVVPNPYIISAEWELSPYVRQIAFTNLPHKCDIHIYTLTGEKVNTLHHESETEGWEFWNMLTFNGQEIAYGLYIYVVETPNGRKKMGKFAVIK